MLNRKKYKHLDKTQHVKENFNQDFLKLEKSIDKISQTDSEQNASIEKTSRFLDEPFAAISHMLGVPIGIAGLVVLIIFSARISTLHVMVSIVYSFAMIMLYTFSSLYHSFAESKAKRILRKFDHISIFVFIAGTYTPICLIPLKGQTGIYMFIAVWSCVILGAILKSVRIGKSGLSNIIGALLYIAMGWICIFAIIPIIKAFSHSEFVYLTLGGVLYTIGALIYMTGNMYKNKIKHITHNIFHIFVLGGSIMHYMLILNLVSV